MSKRLGQHELVDIASLSNYILKFNKKSKTPNVVYANVEPQENSTVYGAVYRITEEQLIQMDDYEGFISPENPENHYDRQEVEVTLEKQKTVLKVITYIASKKYRSVENALKPTQTYLNSIIIGATDLGISQVHIDEIYARGI